MHWQSLTNDLEAGLDGGTLALRGELTRLSGPVLLSWLHTLPVIVVLDLAELDIRDGVAATHAFDAVRLLCSRVAILRIVAAPQALAHTFYRTGLLAEGGIELEAMREDEAYG
jgi:anti-anti-sigma regulatory factor